MSSINVHLNGNAGGGEDGNRRRRPGIPQPPQPPKPKKEISKQKKRRELIAELLVSYKYPPIRIENPPMLPYNVSAVTRVGTSGGLQTQARAAIPNALDMMVAPSSPPPLAAPPCPRDAMSRLETRLLPPFKLAAAAKVEQNDHPHVDPNVPTEGEVMGAKPNVEATQNVPTEGNDDDNIEVNLNEAKADDNGNGVVYSIILRGYSVGDVGVMYTIRSDETFEAIYDNYAFLIDVKPEKIKVYNGTTYIPRTAYPEPMGVATGSVLYVQGLEGVVNTNTRIKRFYLKNTGHRRKIKFRVQGKLDTPLCRLFHIWGEKTHVDPTDLVFYHEDKVVCTLNTIRDSGILNGDKVVVAPFGDENR